ncbi:exported hypothetical protein [Acidobacteriia bacterium SbA2]|nr:exported hypothetical protein [Acidobacteriia bacterium SbA2]
MVKKRRKERPEGFFFAGVEGAVVSVTVFSSAIGLSIN